MKKTLLLLFILVGIYGYGQVVAVPDTFTVLQANVDTFDLVQNDTFPAGDSVCITLLDSNARFTLLDCRRVVYSADSFHTGVDSVQYVICDTAMVCDTNFIKIRIENNFSLLPIATFITDTSRFSLFGQAGVPSCFTYFLYNQSTQADSVSWEIRALSNWSCGQNVLLFQFSTDTISLNIWEQVYCLADQITVSLAAFNRFGQNTTTDTSAILEVCEGINEMLLGNTRLYPSPTSGQLTIDMEQNTDAITSDYRSIDLMNTLGQGIRKIPRSGNNKSIQINVTDLPEGIYNATITDDKGATRALGHFTIAH